ncbi:MAG: dockerin type I domain-containing protein [Tepidisphaeraceae bacterium]
MGAPAKLRHPKSWLVEQLNGDANGDNRVNFQDLLILAQYYGTTGNTVSHGNFDYSNDGAVNFSDLLIVAQHYGVALTAAVTESTTNAPMAPLGTQPAPSIAGQAVSGVSELDRLDELQRRETEPAIL